MNVYFVQAWLNLGINKNGEADKRHHGFLIQLMPTTGDPVPELREKVCNQLTIGDNQIEHFEVSPVSYDVNNVKHLFHWSEE